MDIGEKQTEFTIELESLLEKYDIDKKYRCPKHFLAQYLIDQLNYTAIFGWVATVYGTDVFTHMKGPVPEPVLVKANDPELE